jgi:MFS family permease
MHSAAVHHPSRWLNRTVIGIGLASLFSDLSHEVVTSLLPALLASMGAAAGALGTIEGFADGLSSVAKLYGGWLADRLPRRKPLCAGGYAAMAAAPLIIAAAAAWPVVLAGRVLAWISRGLRTPARKALLADAVPREAYGRAFGLERAMDTCGAILAPLLVVVLLKVGWSQRTLLILSALPALVPVLAIGLLVREREGRTAVRRPFLHTFKGLGRRFNEFLGAVGLFGLGDFADTFFILYAVTTLSPSMGMAQATSVSVGLYALHNVLYASCSYMGGWLSDRANRFVVLVFGYAAAALAALCIVASVSSLAGLALMFALAGTGVGLYEAVQDAVGADLLASELRGSGFGALAAVTGVGDWLSSLAVGWVWAVWGAPVAGAYAMAFMLAGALWMMWLGRTRQ